MTHVLVHELVFGEVTSELVELFVGWQFTENQQVGGFGEDGTFGQFLDGVAAIAQDALLAVDEGDVALAGAGVAIAAVEAPVSARSRLISMPTSASLPTTTGSEYSLPRSFRVAVSVMRGSSTG